MFKWRYFLGRNRHVTDKLPLFIAFSGCFYYMGEDYDLILGPMANDDVYRTFTLYTAGILTKEQALEQLKIKKLYDQLVLTSVKALSYLRFVGTVPEEEF